MAIEKQHSHTYKWEQSLGVFLSNLD